MLSNLNNCLELSRGELDLVILANIQVFTSMNITGEKRKCSAQCSFLYFNRPICKDMSLNLFGISYSRFRRLKEHYEEHRISQRVHGNRKRLPHNTLPHAVTEDVKNFLNSYAEENTIVLPGRIPGFKNDIRLLSSSETKMSVWHAFKTACEGLGKQAVSYTKFINLWEQIHPEILVAQTHDRPVSNVPAEHGNSCDLQWESYCAGRCIIGQLHQGPQDQNFSLLPIFIR